MRIVFMGTPEFAIPSLELINKEFGVITVITSPDKSGGRGHKLIESPVKKWAIEHDISILQPERLKKKSFIFQLQSLNADLFVVVAFRMLPEIIWSMPSLGTINLHASLLPKYRGAAPIQRAIMAGEPETGISIFKLRHEIDTGDIMIQERLEIGPNETGGSLHDRMKIIGAELILKGLKLIEHSQVTYLTQENELASTAPKIFHEDCKIQWNRSVHDIYNQIRALSPYPGAWFIHEGTLYKIIESKKLIHDHEHSPEKWISDQKTFLHISCMNGYIDVIEIQQQGKRKMLIKEFLNGHKIH
ncbi:MAG: methionyl-tRNA formyltransferase [Bacteroidota bacterium]|nr:methionyl-tRNA formyltransferase [Bacteroidota bacterium]